MSPGRCGTPPPSSPTTSSYRTSPNGSAKANSDEPLLEAKFTPFALAIGSSLSREELMIGWQDQLGHRYPKSSELTLLQDDVFFRAFPVAYATDALNPLDVQFHYTNVAEDGLVLSECGLLGPGGCKAIDITFHLHRPPLFWVVVNGVRRRGTERDTLLDGGYEADGVARGELRNFAGVSCLGEASALKLGRWLSYRFSLPATDLPRLKSALHSLNLVHTFKPLKQSLFTNYHYSGVALLSRQFRASLPFNLRYAIDGLLSFGIIIDSQVEQLLELLKVEITDPEKVDKAERILHSLFRSTRIWDADLTRRIESVRPFILSRPKRPPQSHMVFVAKAVVTPTRVLLFPPECQTSNAVLRAFPKETAEGRFIRVQFWDEGNRLSMGYEVKGDDLDSREGILSRFRRCLKYGLEFGGRKYYALDYSASQARTNAFWAVCEDTASGFTRVKIRAVLGDFSDERIVAKHAARRGQLFSTTRDIGIVDKVGRIPDFKTEDEEYTFSDGVGICTQDLATTAAETLGFATNVASRTSAIQVRHGGTKGMLAVWPPRPSDANGDPLFMDLEWPEVGATFEPHYDILVRPSQVKFKSVLMNLGVVRVSVYSHAFLNREVLTLLFPRGVRHSDVTREFECQVNEILGSEDALTQGGGMRPHHSRLFANSKFAISDLVHAGFHEEPFVRALARLFANRALWDLKWKARIYIEQGVNLLGVVDELGTLEEGQIYCRTIDREGREHTVTGKCIIFRAPTRHPGDVQIVEAVDNPALRSAGLTNVIIFNRDGDRDLPSMLGGGDLDGDDYTLIWDRRLTNIRPHEPMDYIPGTLPVKVEKGVTSTQVREFHTEYMKLDTLGAISNAHLALADLLGPEHPDALELCNLHSKAVDFAKRIYKSKSPLGEMYRHPQLNPLPPIKPVEATFLDPRLAHIPVPIAIFDMAKRLKGAYDLEVQQLMLQFQAQEEEVVAGVVLELPGGLRRVEKDSKLRDPLTMAYESVRFDFVERVRAWSASGKASPPTSLTRIELMAVAAYRCTYEAAQAEPTPKRRMLSFPFIFKDTLVELVQRGAACA